MSDELDYHIFICHPDGRVSFGESCDAGCDECDVASQNTVDGACFVHENTVHVVSCDENLDATVLVYANHDLNCQSDLSDEDAFATHLHESGECTVNQHDHNEADGKLPRHS